MLRTGQLSLINLLESKIIYKPSNCKITVYQAGSLVKRDNNAAIVNISSHSQKKEDSFKPNKVNERNFKLNTFNSNALTIRQTLTAALVVYQDKNKKNEEKASLVKSYSEEQLQKPLENVD